MDAQSTVLVLAVTLLMSACGFHGTVATPTRTANVNQGKACSQGTERLSNALISASRAEMAVSRAEMELSKAEASVGINEALWNRWVKITIFLFLALIGYGAWIVIVALREEKHLR